MFTFDMLGAPERLDGISAFYVGYALARENTVGVADPFIFYARSKKKHRFPNLARTVFAIACQPLVEGGSTPPP